MKRREAAGNAIDRGIGVGRVGVENPTFDSPIFFEKCTARQQKLVRAPKTVMRLRTKYVCMKKSMHRGFRGPNIFLLARRMFSQEIERCFFDAESTVAKWAVWVAKWAGLGWLAGRFIVIFIFIKDISTLYKLLPELDLVAEYYCRRAPAAARVALPGPLPVLALRAAEQALLVDLHRHAAGADRKAQAALGVDAPERIRDAEPRKAPRACISRYTERVRHVLTLLVYRGGL